MISHDEMDAIRKGLNSEFADRGLRFRVRVDDDRDGYEIMVVDAELRYARVFVPHGEMPNEGARRAAVVTLLNMLNDLHAVRELVNEGRRVGGML